MSLLWRVRAVLNLFLRRKSVEAELHDDVEAFYETMVERYMGEGMADGEARRLARLQFGHPENVKEQVRDARAGMLLDLVIRNLQYTFRVIRKAPGYATVTLLTLGVGIGANATVFSIVSRFVLHHPPVGDPSTLIAIHTTQGQKQCCNNFSWPLYKDLSEQAKSFSRITAYYDLLPASIAGTGEPERIWGQAVTANFFDIASLRMEIGRGFTAEEEHVPAVVISDRLWRRRFDSDPEIVGKPVRLSGRSYTVVGVAPPGFRGLDIILDAQFWVPLDNIDSLLPNTANRTSRTYHWLAVAGRLAPGVTAAQAAAELRVLSDRFAKAYPESVPVIERDTGFRIDEAGSLPPRDRTTILVFLTTLLFVAVLVLCIACANVVNLSVAQANGRRRDIAVRLALGATRWNLLSQMLTESVVLSLGGGMIGVALSLWATRAVAVFRLAAPVPLDLSLSVNTSVLLYAFFLSVSAGILFGLAPTWSVVHSLVGERLSAEQMLTRSGRMWSVRNLIVVSQITMSVVLLCATGLFLHSLENASSIDIGFRSRGLLMMSIDPRLNGYSDDRSVQLLQQLRERVARLPGVISATYTDVVPLSGGHRSDAFAVEGKAAQPGNSTVDLYMASPGYFDTMGIERVAGRVFESDKSTFSRTAVVNQVFGKRFFGRENPIGQRVRDGDRVYEIIGVVKNTKSRTLGEDPRPVLYRSLAQDISGDPSAEGYTVIARFAGDPGALANAMHGQIHSVAPSLAIFDAKTIEEHLKDALFLPRLAGALFGTFGFLGLGLASVGLYGVISHWVSRRTREIGIRLAVGARAGEVQRLVIRQGMTLAVVAIVPGLLIAWCSSRLLASFLYGLPNHDTVTFAYVPLFLAAVTFLACWIPSRRVLKVDPNVALRHD
jgi:predicted permease